MKKIIINPTEIVTISIAEAQNSDKPIFAVKDNKIIGMIVRTDKGFYINLYSTYCINSLIKYFPTLTELIDYNKHLTFVIDVELKV